MIINCMHTCDPYFGPDDDVFLSSRNLMKVLDKSKIKLNYRKNKHEYRSYFNPNPENKEQHHSI